MNVSPDKTTKHSKSYRRPANIRVIRSRKSVKVSLGRIIILGLAIYFVIWSFYPLTYRLEQSRELDELAKGLNNIKQQNEEIKKEIEYLKSDEFVEQKARSLGLSRPDEEVIKVIPDKVESQVLNKDLREEKSGVERNNEATGDSFWQRIIGIFSSIF